MQTSIDHSSVISPGILLLNTIPYKWEQTTGMGITDLDECQYIKAQQL